MLQGFWYGWHGCHVPYYPESGFVTIFAPYTDITSARRSYITHFCRLRTPQKFGDISHSLPSWTFPPPSFQACFHLFHLIYLSNSNQLIHSLWYYLISKFSLLPVYYFLLPTIFFCCGENFTTKTCLCIFIIHKSWLFLLVKFWMCLNNRRMNDGLIQHTTEDLKMIHTHDHPSAIFSLRVHSISHNILRGRQILLCGLSFTERRKKMRKRSYGHRGVPLPPSFQTFVCSKCLKMVHFAPKHTFFGKKKLQNLGGTPPPLRTK